jgi:PAS domain S-box-containing protein
LLEFLPVAVVACGADGQILQCNRKTAELWGREPDPAQRLERALPLLRPDGRRIDVGQGPMAEALRTGELQRGTALIVEQPSGRRTRILANVDLIRDEAGAVTGAVGCFTVVTAGARADNELDEPEPLTEADIGYREQAEKYAARLASIVEFSDDAIVSKDLNGVITSWNAGAQRLFGYAPEEIIGKPIYILIPPERHNEEPGILARIRRGEPVDHYETVRRRKDGGLVDISITVSPLKNTEGAIIGASKIARDISERKREEERRRLLINELNHRVKNTLATVQSISAQTFRGESGDRLRVFEKRLVALSRAHEILTHESWEGADLRELAGELIAPLCIDVENRVDILGPRLRVRPKIALSLSMALHELCANAVKYGALAEGSGRVQLGWSVARSAGEDWLRVRWEESGGPAVRSPSRSGFGTKLLERSVARELGARVRLQFLQRGVVCEIEAPLQ